MADRNHGGSRIISSCPLCGVDVLKLEKHLNELCLARPLPGQSILKGVCPHCLDDVGVECLNEHLMKACLSLTVPCPFCKERYRQIQQHLKCQHRNKQNHPAFSSVVKPPNPYKSLNGTLPDIVTDGLLKVVIGSKALTTSEAKQVISNGNSDSEVDAGVADKETNLIPQTISDSTLGQELENFSDDFVDKKAKKADIPENLNSPKKKNSKTLIRCQLCGNKILLNRFCHHVNSKCLARPLPGQSLEPGHCPHCLMRVRLDEMAGHLMYTCEKLTVRCPFCHQRFRQIRQHLIAKHKNKSHLPDFLCTTKIPNPFKILRGNCLNVPEPFCHTPEVSNQVATDSSSSDTEIDYASFLIRPPKT